MCSRKLLRENDNVMRPNYRSVTTFCTASVNNVMTFSAYKSDRNIFYKQFNFGLAPQTFGLVTSSNSLPEGQPHLFIFVSPCKRPSQARQTQNFNTIGTCFVMSVFMQIFIGNCYANHLIILVLPNQLYLYDSSIS